MSGCRVSKNIICMEMRIEVELTKLTPGGWDKALMMMFLSYGPKR